MINQIKNIFFNYNNSLFLLSAFPFIGIPQLQTDIMPWALLFSLTIILLRNVNSSISFNIPSFNSLLILFFLCAFTRLLVTMIDANQFSSFEAIRLFLSYLTIPVIINVIYFSKNNLNPKLLKKVVIVWFLASLIQIFIKDFGSFLIPGFRGEGITAVSGRGSNSFAPEPTEHARMMVAFMILSYFFYSAKIISSRDNKIIHLLCTLSGLFSLSGTGYLMIISYFLLFFTFAKESSLILKFVPIISFIIFTSIFLYFGIKYLPDNRVFYLLGILLEDPSRLFKSGGFILRVFNFTHSINIGIIETFGIGTGIGEMKPLAEFNSGYNYNIFESFNISVGSRAHGGIIGIIYNLGIFGFLWIAWIVNIFTKILKRSSYHSIRSKWTFFMLAFLMISFFEGSINNPILAVLLSFMIKISNEKTLNSKVL